MNDPATSHDQREISNVLRKQNGLLEDIAEAGERTCNLIGYFITAWLSLKDEETNGLASAQQFLKEAKHMREWQRPSKRKEKGDG